MLEAATLIPVVPALPLLGFVVLLFLGRRLPHAAVNAVACGSVLLAFLAASAAFVDLGRTPPRVDVTLYPWLSAGAFQADVAFSLDPLSGLLCLVITGVGFLIHVYSTGYMHEEKDYARYFALLNLFTFAMLVLVLGKNLPVMFVGWEGVGLCSYLLIGFDYCKDSAAAAGKKAFVVNRIGDAGFLLGTFLIFDTFQTVDIGAVLDRLGEGHPASQGALTAIALLLFVGATGKSAQIPLFVWLPDAMAGPTPVSALIHAATMVTAGVYMIARLAPIYAQSVVAMTVIAIVGAATALMAATIGVVQNDIKKVLAYSTVSQLGYMFLGLGAGAFPAAIFHLITHAFFKALLFLGSGSVIHALHGEQDIRKMGGLKKLIPKTWATFLVGTLAIAGMPFMSGFFSKDAILAGVYHSRFLPHGLALTLTAVGFTAALLTSFYMFRLLLLTFYGESRMDEHTAHHVHESPRSMLLPLLVLAILSSVGGFLGFPEVFGHALHIPDVVGTLLDPAVMRGMEYAPASLTRPLAPAEMKEHETVASELMLMGVSLVVFLAGLQLAWSSYLPTSARAEARARQFPGLHRLLSAKYYWDEVYDALFVKPLGRLSKFLLAEVDLGGIDFAVNLVAVSVETLGNLLKFLHTGFVRNYALAFLAGVVILVAWLG